jgi:hypothetical protein
MTVATRRRFLIEGLAAWAVLPVLALGNAALREIVLVPTLGAAAALPLSGLVLTVLVFAVAGVLHAMSHQPRTAGDLWGLGAIWLALTASFEMALIVATRETSTDAVLAALDPSGGNLFALVLVATFLAPRLVATLLPRAPRH